MSEHDNQDLEQAEAKQPRKISLEEAIRNKLAQKKQTQVNNPAGQKKIPGSDKQMKSQQTKKVNNQRRKTGGG